MEQKDFVMSMVDKLLKVSTTLSYSSTISINEKSSEINGQDTIHKRRRRVNHKCLRITPGELLGPTNDNFMTLSLKRGACEYCT